jgi:hypothetical protein
MPYAKIDKDGNVVKFPVRVSPLQPTPSNFVDVDIAERIPKNLKWYQGALWDTVDKVGDKYIVNYKVVESYPPNSIEKKKAFESHVSSLRKKTNQYYQMGRITKEQVESNNLTLDTVNPDNESTYDQTETLEFNMYARIDADGNVLEFPVVLKNYRETEENIVKVDTEKNKPKDLKWYQAAWYDNAVKDGEEYVANYTIGDRKFSSVEESSLSFKYFIEMYKGKNELRYKEESITKEQYDANLTVLNSINVEDRNCYDDFDKLVF